MTMYVFDGHLHVACPASDVATPHNKHAVAPFLFEYVLGSQGLHKAAAGTALNLPKEHGMHGFERFKVEPSG